jgi:hypothetical protein
MKRLLLAALLALAGTGCVMTHPDWAYFDAGRYPAGAVPAQAGFYAGAYASSPFVLIFGVCKLGACMGEKDEVESDWGQIKAVSAGIGVLTGFAVGAPFHLVALPWRWWKGGEAGPGDAVEEIEQPRGWDERPPAVPRDYPWPPVLQR